MKSLAVLCEGIKVTAMFKLKLICRRSVTSFFVVVAYTERRRGEHKSSTLALRSPDDIFPPRGNFLFGDEESCQATSTPLAASICDDPALIANRLQLRDKRKQLGKKGVRSCPVEGCAEARCWRALTYPSALTSSMSVCKIK